MPEDSKTMEQMRDEKVPWPETAEELSAYISDLVERRHDYNTCVYAMSMAATAAFHYVAGKLGTTGFQAQFADLDIIRRTRHIKGPFMLLDAQDLLFPWYNVPKKVADWIAEPSMRSWLRDEATRLLAESPNAHPDVRERWMKLQKHEIAGGE